MFYDLFCQLCKQKGVAPTRAALDIGLSKATPTTWKRGITPQAAQLQKIAEYFGVSVDYLLGNEEKTSSSKEKDVTDEDIKFALFKGAGGISDEAYEEVKAFAEFVKQKYKKGNKDK